MNQTSRVKRQVWSSGSQVLYREIVHGKVWTARPVIVVQDAPDLIALYLPNHTPWKVCTPLDAGDDLVLCKANLHPWELRDVVWSYGDTVFLIRPGRSYAVHVMWDPQQRFVGWYINFQEPARRTRLGFDFLDQELDMVVSPNLDWRWKDRDHLGQAQDIGLFSPEQVRAILREGKRVIESIRMKATPFDGSWNSWRPPLNWSVPRLPEGWEQVS